LLGVAAIGAATLSHYRKQKSISVWDSPGEVFFCLPRDLDHNAPVRLELAGVAERRKQAIATCPDAQRLLQEGHAILLRQQTPGGEWQVYGARPLVEQPGLP
jgi:hypothetical protein